MAEQQPPQLYGYSHSTGEYTGPIAWDPNPENPDAPLRPAFATTEKPPEEAQGVTPKFTGDVDGNGTWALVPDFRGEIWFQADGSPVLVDQLGDPTTFKAPLVEKAPPPNLPPRPVTTSKADMWRRCTDQEATNLFNAMESAPVRQRETFKAAQIVDHSDEFFPTLQAIVTATVGADRAAVILAPTAGA